MTATITATASPCTRAGWSRPAAGTFSITDTQPMKTKNMVPTISAMQGWIRVSYLLGDLDTGGFLPLSSRAASVSSSSIFSTPIDAPFDFSAWMRLPSLPQLLRRVWTKSSALRGVVVIYNRHQQLGHWTWIAPQVIKHQRWSIYQYNPCPKRVLWHLCPQVESGQVIQEYLKGPFVKGLSKSKTKHELITVNLDHESRRDQEVHFSDHHGFVAWLHSSLYR